MNIYVANLVFRAEENDVRELFEQYGTVEKVSLPTDRETGKKRGFGFVEMPDDEAGQKAIDGLNGFDFQGRKLVVNKAKPRD